MQSFQSSTCAAPVRPDLPDGPSVNREVGGDKTVLEYYDSEDEEGVDALGTVVFADEVESGFYGKLNHQP